ncbi:hypothetical protein LRP67_16325 [Nocardioides sp. cx-169]|uniref:hypothetical protein n=1 Tax=Nocardioides sp. cx-169 TaxID=2899080 RepID=UPI001E575608|nr:hypothetical protein [Nocardioides sp. cx-169]MCD4535660.1 hypothetical protein [Nocardioides sp. cx-169]
MTTAGGTLGEVLAEVLRGIDQTEADGSGGWWEVSTGAGFGAERLAATEAAVLAWIAERLDGARDEVAADVASTFGGWHDPDPEQDGDDWTPEADAALTAVRTALGIEAP